MIEDVMMQIKHEKLIPSKIQSLISELFRLQLCRNDDKNLAQSAVIKNLKFQTGQNQGSQSHREMGQ
jgi:hypothetical protein